MNVSFDIPERDRGRIRVLSFVYGFKMVIALLRLLSTGQIFPLKCFAINLLLRVLCAKPLFWKTFNGKVI